MRQLLSDSALATLLYLRDAPAVAPASAILVVYTVAMAAADKAQCCCHQTNQDLPCMKTGVCPVLYTTLMSGQLFTKSHCLLHACSCMQLSPTVC